MGVGKAPCKDCSDRQIGCHGYCAHYIEWSNANEKEKAMIAKIKHEEAGIAESIGRGINKR